MAKHYCKTQQFWMSLYDFSILTFELHGCPINIDSAASLFTQQPLKAGRTGCLCLPAALVCPGLLAGRPLGVLCFLGDTTLHFFFCFLTKHNQTRRLGTFGDFCVRLMVMHFINQHSFATHCLIIIHIYSFAQLF